MEQRYQEAFSMAELYAIDRPPPIPASEHEQRRHVKDIQEVVDAGRRKGLAEANVRGGLAQLETLLPNILNLHKMKPADWAVVTSDVGAVAEKMIVLKESYPKADIFKVLAKRPKTLLRSSKALADDAAQVKRLLANAPEPDAIIEALPDAIDPISLARSLAYLGSAFAGQDPVLVLQRNPDVVNNLGETTVEMTADYGELTTKD